MNRIFVLDHGYVRYVKHMGDDLDVVNSAKVSFSKESAEFGEREGKLLAFLAREEHTSVFRHSAITFEAFAPFMVARQWYKYAVASTHLEDQNGWNESSRRYITEDPVFYVPDAADWRSAPENRKQGSGELLSKALGQVLTEDLQEIIRAGVEVYDHALESGVAPEQARLFLPAYGLYVRWRWTTSLGALVHFLHQRLGHDAQSEIRDYAIAVKELASDHFPVTIGLI